MRVSRRPAVTVLAAVTVVLAVLAGTTAVERRATGPVSAAAVGDAESIAAGSGVAVAPVTTLPVPPSTVTTNPTTTTTVRTGTTRPSTTTLAASAPPAPRSAQPVSGSFGPEPPGSVNLPYQEGQTVWSATSNGIAMTLRMDTPSPVAGSPLHFVLQASPPAGMPCCFFQLLPGDSPNFSTQTSKTDPAGCANPSTGPQQVSTSVTFNHGGRFAFLFQAASLCVQPSTTGVIYGFVDVGAGRSTAQGPSLPVLKADDGRVPSQMKDPTLAVAWAEARDEDGYIAGFSVDWGDGTVDTFPGDPVGCIQTASGWPRSSESLISGSPTAPPPSHRYASPQQRVITVTTWSTGCDGSEMQRVSSIFPWVPPVL